MNKLSAEEFIEFCELDAENRKTRIVGIYSRSSGMLLGEIRWHSHWRQYCFFPKSVGLNSIWNKDCLDLVLAKIDEMMRERKETQ